MVSRINDLNDLEIIAPESVPGFYGFFYCPLDRRLAVNRTSEVLNIKTGKLIKPIINKISKSCIIMITSPGIKHKAYALHRLVAYTFIGRPTRHLDKEFSCLEVNHINGIRTNNFIDNLEWLTGKENVIHSRDTCLRKDNFKVLVKCIVSGVITVSISVDQCSKDHDIAKPTLHKHLKSGNTLKYHKNGYLFRYQSDGEWPVNHPDEIKDFHTAVEIGQGYRSFGLIDISDTQTGNKFIASSIQAIVDHLHVSYSSIFRRLKRSDYFSLGKYQVRVLKRN